jgi:hypothetical protein
MHQLICAAIQNTIQVRYLLINKKTDLYFIQHLTIIKFDRKQLHL